MTQNKLIADYFEQVQRFSDDFAKFVTAGIADYVEFYSIRAGKYIEAYKGWLADSPAFDMTDYIPWDSIMKGFGKFSA